jgi:hypothetical protein
MSTNDRPPDTPTVAELEVGDVIQTAGLDAMEYPEVRIVRNDRMSLGYRLLATAPIDKPGAVSHYPQRGHLHVTRIRRAHEERGEAYDEWSVHIDRPGEATEVLPATRSRAVALQQMEAWAGAGEVSLWSHRVPAWTRVPAPASKECA